MSKKNFLRTAMALFFGLMIVSCGVKARVDIYMESVASGDENLDPKTGAMTLDKDGVSITVEPLDALDLLLKLEELENSKVISEDTLVAIIGNAGSEDPIVEAGRIKDLIKHEFPEVLQCLVIPSELHFMEAEALVRLAGAPKELLNDL